MLDINRRKLLAGIAAATSLPRVSALAQQSPEPAKATPSFGYEDVVKRARDLAGAPFDAQIPPLPDSIAHLDFDAWRDIRFKADKLLLGQPGTPFRLELFHLGHLYKRPVTVNVLRDGLPAPVPYTASLFDYGHNKFDGALPINLGFAGFRLHYPLNAPHVMDEVIAFLGASYYRFLGRGQRYGLSARGLAIGAGEQEEFPFFREFWIEIAGARRRARDRLRAARRRIGDRRLPVRNLSRHGHQRRSDGDAFARKADRLARHGAAVLDVPGRQERPSLRRRLPHRIARIRTGC